MNPRALLLDEPLAALDAALKAEILPYLERLVRETRIPMLYVSHSLDEVARLADRMVVHRQGPRRRRRLRLRSDPAARSDRRARAAARRCARSPHRRPRRGPWPDRARFRGRGSRRAPHRQAAGRHSPYTDRCAGRHAGARRGPKASAPTTSSPRPSRPSRRPAPTPTCSLRSARPASSPASPAARSNASRSSPAPRLRRHQIGHRRRPRTRLVDVGRGVTARHLRPPQTRANFAANDTTGEGRHEPARPLEECGLRSAVGGARCGPRPNRGPGPMVDADAALDRSLRDRRGAHQRQGLHRRRQRSWAGRIRRCSRSSISRPAARAISRRCRTAPRISSWLR